VAVTDGATSCAAGTGSHGAAPLSDEARVRRREERAVLGGDAARRVREGHGGVAVTSVGQDAQRVSDLVAQHVRERGRLRAGQPADLDARARAFAIGEPTREPRELHGHGLRGVGVAAHLEVRAEGEVPARGGVRGRHLLRRRELLGEDERDRLLRVQHRRGAGSEEERAAQKRMATPNDGSQHGIQMSR
jgi:hypothetical protein